MPRDIQQAVELLRIATHTVALTGAGISTPSGIPDFRSERDGLWKQVDPLDVVSLWAFHDHPQRFYDWFRPLLRKSCAAKPNGAHHILADMERAGRLDGVITQNVDSLHQAAGSRRVIEVHGHLRTASCLDCRSQLPADGLTDEVLSGRLPAACPSCAGLLKPDIILFGEPPPYEALSEAQQLSLGCDVMLIVGTSLEVMPAADLPLLAKRRGARLVMINLAATPLDDHMDVIVRADVVKGLQTLWDALRPVPQRLQTPVRPVAAE